VGFPKSFKKLASVTPIQFLMGIRHGNTANSLGTKKPINGKK